MTEIRIELPISSAAPGIARDALDIWLASLVAEMTAQDARLAATELVANAVRHGGLVDDAAIVLTGLETEDVVRIGLVQNSSTADARPVLQDERAPGAGGFGLRIVDEVSTRWGIDAGPPGVVWFEVEKQR